VNKDKQTSCPHCGANFSVSEEQLRSAVGMVRCGLCLKVFDANSLDGSLDNKGEAEFTAPALEQEEAPNPLANLSLQPMENADIPSPAEPIPLGLKALLLLLVLAMAGQLAFFQFGLRLPEPKPLTIGQLVVRAHPETAGALRMDAVLHNSSDRAQPYPGLFLYLNNRYGERQAQRLFLPAEYLPDQLVEASQLAAHTRIQVSLALHDPGQNAINYGLALHVLPTAEN
jgi:predicted Zn finger-like uncharacterized protein